MLFSAMGPRLQFMIFILPSQRSMILQYFGKYWNNPRFLFKIFKF